MARFFFSWGLSTLFVDASDIFPRNITAATAEILHTNLVKKLLVTYLFMMILREIVKRGDPKMGYLNTGNILTPNFYLLGFQMVK